jgi:hypothetical protein
LDPPLGPCRSIAVRFLERWRLRTASGWRKLGGRLAGRRPIEQISGGK